MRHLKKVGFIFLFLTQVSAGSTFAGPLEDGLAAYDKFDFDTALQTLEPLAKQGNAEAQLRLGLMYRNGWGVPIDFTKAAEWYRLAADQGNAPAQDDLGDLYYDGTGVPKDVAEAIKWEQRASDQGYVESMTELAYAYANGDGAPLDLVKAYMWYRLAAAHGNTDGIKDANDNRDLVAKKMTPEQIEEAEQLARDWKPKSGL